MWLLEASIRNAQEIMFDSWNLKRAAGWKLKFCWFPKKCALSKKRLWGKFAYTGATMFTGPGEPIIETYWIEKKEFIIWSLKNERIY
jgi:hypothetical protein